MLAGLVSVAALLGLAVAERLGLWLGHLFGIEISDVWLLAAVIFLASVNEWLQ